MAEEIRLRDRNLALEAVRVTERAAIASATWMGRGDEKAADQAAVDAMRQALNVLDIEGTVVIGEGERDEAPMLYIGEKVGSGRGPRVDIALDPLEGTTITADRRTQRDRLPRHGRRGRLSERARRLHGQDRRRRRPARPASFDIDATARREPRPIWPRPRASTSAIWWSCILDRPRHQELIARVRETGARIRADPRRRRRRRDRDRTARQRHRHLRRHRRRARGRAGGSRAALDRRPDAGPAALSQRRRAGARAQDGYQRSRARSTICMNSPRAT